MKSHINIPIFIPHMGCPNQCVFCNQRIISGVDEFSAESIVNIIEEALLSKAENTTAEIAFFGGSFTGIDRSLMLKLLDIAHSYVKNGSVSAIRCSTRPDYINDEIIEILKQYGVTSVELGIQSTAESVLVECKRGHSRADTVTACKKLVEAGFTLGGQMMIGLPGSTVEDEIQTAEFIARSGATEARIYPTVVFRKTELHLMTEKGEYTPLSLEDAVDRSARVFDIFAKHNIKVLRIGLCDSENLHSDDTYYAGPNHPALGELVINRLYYRKIRRLLKEVGNKKISSAIITAPKGHVSKVVGQNKININLLKHEFSLDFIKVRESSSLEGYNILLEIQERK